jgi:hypothetical protein
MSFMLWLLYPRYPLVRRLGVPQSRYGCYAEEKNLTPAGIRAPATQLVARGYTDLFGRNT